MDRKSGILEGLLYLFAGMSIVLLSYYIPVLIILLILFSVPCTVLGYRYSVLESVLFLCAMTVFLVITGDMVSLIPVLSSGLSGVVMGSMLRGKRPAGDAIKNGFLAALISLVGIFGIFIVFFRLNIIQEFVNALPKIVDSSLDIYRSMGLGEQELNVIKTVLEQAVHFIGMSIPFDILMYSAIASIVGYLVVEVVLRRADIDRLKPFSLWKVSDRLSMVLVIVYLIETIFRSNYTVYMVTFNILLGLVTVFTVDGYSLLLFFMKKSGLKSWLQVLVVLLSFFIPVFSFALTGAGILDATFDFRHIKKRG
ncbi:MAG: DUF2232 domain-containing protein [Thermoanaerobacteraceae bacterium]|nr:DUF2232 domain-containing protein [Thermoanaerobacteraceae bacterium]